MKQLQDVGLSKEQAETYLEILAEIMSNELATRQDLKDVRIELKQDLKDSMSWVALEFAQLRAETRQLEQRMIAEFAQVRLENKNLEQRLTLKLGTIASIALGVAVTLVQILK